MAEDEPDFITIAVPDLGTPETPGEIYVGHGVSCTVNQQLWYAVRPEKVRLSRAGTEGRRNSFAGVVEDVAYMGGLSVYRVRLDSGRLISATRSNLTRHDEDPITWEDRVSVSWEDNGGVVLTR